MASNHKDRAFDALDRDDIVLSPIHALPVGANRGELRLNGCRQSRGCSSSAGERIALSPTNSFGCEQSVTGPVGAAPEPECAPHDVRRRPNDESGETP